MSLSAAALGKIAELANTSRTDNAAFFTSKTLITEMMKSLPDTDQLTVRILEPSVGVGNFIPLILKKFEGKKIIIDFGEKGFPGVLVETLAIFINTQGCPLKTNVSRVDVVIATPPCQGMSVANHKKSSTEIVRNSLVIESIKIIKQINPRFFIE